MSGAFHRRPPGGEPVRAGQLAHLLRERDPGERLAARLRERLGVEHVGFHASGREALRALLVAVAARTGRGEVLVPAYTCYSVPSAVAAAGLRVRLVEVDARGALDAGRLADAPLRAAAALVVCNLFGVPEPLAPLREIAAAAGVFVVDDAAQSFGAASCEGPVGGRGDAGILSLGRGKPLSGLGGGVLVGSREAELAAPPRPAGGRASALLRALAYDAALSPRVFPWLARLPGLEVGVTRFDPGFRRGAIRGDALALADAHLAVFDAEVEGRRALAQDLGESVARAGLTPLAAPSRQGVYPRLVLRAPDATRRERLLERLRPLGASGMYPAALSEVAALVPHRADAERCPVAEDLARRILTLPLHPAIAEGLDELV